MLEHLSKEVWHPDGCDSFKGEVYPQPFPPALPSEPGRAGRGSHGCTSLNGKSQGCPHQGEHRGQEVQHRVAPAVGRDVVRSRWCSQGCHTVLVTCSAMSVSNVTALEAAARLCLKLKRKRHGFEVRRCIMNSTKCRSHLPREKLEHAPLTGVKRVEGNRSRRGCFTSPVPTVSKMPLCSAAASILISITTFTSSSRRSLAFEAAVQFSSSQHFLMRYAKKTSLLVAPNDNYKLSRSSPKPLPFFSPY